MGRVSLKGWNNCQSGVWKQFGRYGGYPATIVKKERFVVNTKYSIGNPRPETGNQYVMNGKYSFLNPKPTTGNAFVMNSKFTFTAVFP